MGIGQILFVLVGLPVMVAAGLWYARRRFEVQKLANEVTKGRQENPNAEALAILNRRLARGEISPDEYRTLRSTMEDRQDHTK